MGYDDNPLYLIREACDSELSNAFGKDNPYQIEPNRITQGYGAPLQRIFGGRSSQSPGAAIPVSTIPYGASYEHDPGAPWRFQELTTLSNRLDQPSPTRPNPEQFNAISQRPSFSGCDGSEDAKMTHDHTDNTYHEIPQDADSLTDSKTSGFSVPRPTDALYTIQGAGQGPQRVEESAGGAFQEVEQGVGGSPFPAIPQEVGEYPSPPGGHSMTSRYPDDSISVLKFMKKDGGGRATCLWTTEGDTCSFFSQVDLVKRHIKRMHYCLK